MRRPAVALAFVLVACTNAGTGGDIEGSWGLVSFDTGESIEEVKVGDNAEEQPWVMFEADEVEGNQGCNAFRGRYVYSDGELRFEGLFSELKGCFGETPEDDSMMTTEIFIQENFFADESIQVSISGGEMIWRSGDTALRWKER